MMTYIPSTLYIGFIDWGDGTKIEYDSEGKMLSDSSLIKHEYKESGIYEIRGEIFNVAVDVNISVYIPELVNTCAFQL